MGWTVSNPACRAVSRSCSADSTTALDRITGTGHIVAQADGPDRRVLQHDSLRCIRIAKTSAEEVRFSKSQCKKTCRASSNQIQSHSCDKNIALHSATFTVTIGPTSCIGPYGSRRQQDANLQKYKSFTLSAAPSLMYAEHGATLKKSRWTSVWIQTRARAARKNVVSMWTLWGSCPDLTGWTRSDCVRSQVIGGIDIVDSCVVLQVWWLRV